MISNSNDKILTEREVCNWLGVSEPTLFRHRRDGTGPKFIQLSARRVGYRHSAVETWLDRQEQRRPAVSTSAHPRKRASNSGATS